MPLILIIVIVVVLLGVVVRIAAVGLDGAGRITGADCSDLC